MHIECHFVIRDAVRELFLLSEVELERAVKVESCEPKYGAMLTSRVAFDLAHIVKLNATDGGHLGPLEIANLILENLRGRGQLESRDFFSFSLGGGGHINSTPSDIFVDSYFARLWKIGVDVLFSQVSFVVCECNSEGGPREGSNINWSDIFSRCREEKSDDVALFAHKLLGQEFVSFRDKLMALALLADRELEVKPYLLGLCGRQNIPWYFDKFVSDVSSYLSKYPIIEVPQWGIATEEMFMPVIIKILEFRHKFFLAAEEGKPWLVVRQLIEMIRDFYTFFHHPSFLRRQTCLNEHGVIIAHQAAFLAQVIRSLLAISLRYLGLARERHKKT